VDTELVEGTNPCTEHHNESLADVKASISKVRQKIDQQKAANRFEAMKETLRSMGRAYDTHPRAEVQIYAILDPRKDRVSVL
jgi:hypothetical protein